MELIPENDPRLLQKSIPYTKEEIKHPDTREFSRSLHSFMLANNGVGIAGVQVGILKQIFVINVPGFNKVVFNPQILKRSGSCEFNEMCLTYGTKEINITRSSEITVKYLDLNANLCYGRLTGISARVFQHEFDHLQGKIFIQYEKN